MADRANLRFSMSLSIDLGLIGPELTIRLGGGGSARGDRSEVKEEE